MTKKQKLIESLTTQKDSLTSKNPEVWSRKFRIQSRVLTNCADMRPRLKPYGRVEGQASMMWAAGVDSVPFIKNVRDCENVVRNLSGWWTSDACDSSCLGLVGQIRLKDKGLKFITGYRYSSWEGIQWDLSDTYDDETKAAHSADSWACQVAERDRESDEEFQREQSKEYAREELERVKKELFGLMIDAERKSLKRQAESVQRAVQREIERLKAYREQLEGEIENA